MIRWARTFAVISSLMLMANGVRAQEDFFSTIDVESTDETSAADDAWFSGFIKQKVKVGVDVPDQNFPFQRDSRGVSQVQTDIFTEAHRSLAENTNFRASVKIEVDWVQWQSGEQEFEINREKVFLKDAYVDHTSASNLWLRAGHQIFAWGDSEGLAITDVLSPRDLREPGQAELRDIREHIPALFLSKPVGIFTLSSVVSYAAGTNRIADRNEEFYPFIGLVDTVDFIESVEADKEWEFAARIDMQFNGADVSFIFADVNDNQQVIGFDESRMRPVLQQERQKVLGVNINKVWGSWLMKAELAKLNINERELFADNKDQTRAMLGVEYSVWNNLTLSAELNALRFDYSQDAGFSGSGAERTLVGGVARARHTSFNERWINQLWYLQITEDDSEILRWDSTWEWSDQLELGTAVVFYNTKKRSDRLYPYRKNDVVELSLRWSF